MVMTAPPGPTKVATWDELLRSGLVINGHTVQAHGVYAYVRQTENGGIQRPTAFTGVQVLRCAEPYSPAIHGHVVGMTVGVPVVMVRFRVRGGSWTRATIRTAASMGLVAPEALQAAAVHGVCLPHFRLGLLKYE